MEKYFNPGLISFIHKFLDTGIREKIEKQCSIGGQLYDKKYDMRYRYYWGLINALLNTEFKDQSEYKKVDDLPQDQKIKALDALGRLLGMNPHNGNEYLVNVYNKFIKL